MSTRILIDTEIWSFGFKKPVRDMFESDDDYNAHFELHKKANLFLSEKLKNNIIFMSYHQLAEIWHVLTMRGKKIPEETAYSIIRDIMKSKNIILKNVTIEDIKQSLFLSKESGIHVWDFLVAIPCRDEIEVIYTMDKHFKDKSFKKIARIENPIGKWLII